MLYLPQINHIYNMDKKIPYIDHIDFLRAIAVIVVILFHLDVSFFSGGFLGVDVFFVISGFLITRNLKTEFENTNKIDFKKFYIRRIRRLIPSLLLMLVFTFILGFLFFPPSLFSKLVKSMFFSSFAISNFYFLSETSYFDTASSLKPLLHTWSLAIEEQFYLIYPLTLLIIIKILRKRTSILITLFMLLALSFALNFFTSKGFISETFISYFISENNFAENVSSIQFFLIPFRIFEFLIGAILVFLPTKNKISNENVRTALNVLGLLLIIGSSILFNSETKFVSTLNIIPCLGAALFILNAPKDIINSVYRISIFKTLGKISYTLYLFHWPIIVFYKFIQGSDTNFFEKTLLAIITYFISYLIYKFYENPLRNNNLESRILSNSGMIGAILFLLIIISNIKTNVQMNDGWLWRVDKKNIENLAVFDNPVVFWQQNWGAQGYKPDSYIGHRKKGTSPDMIWFGDSHAGHYSFGLDSIMVKKHKKNIYMGFGLSSLHLPDIVHKLKDNSKTKKYFDEMLEFINTNPEVPLVISHFWNAQMANVKIDNDNLTLDSVGYKKVCQKIVKLSKLISDRDLIVIGENPYKADHDLSYIDNLLIPKYFSKVNAQSTFEPVKFTFEMNDYFETFFDDYKNIHFINPSNVFCTGNDCLEQESGKIYFSDKDHLTKTGALKVIQSIEKELLKFTVDAEYLKPNQVLKHTSSKLDFNGWYNPEKLHRWSKGDSSEITFKIRNKKEFKGEVMLNIGIIDQQEIKVFINDSIIGSKNLSKNWNSTLSLSFDPSLLNETDNILKLEYSNAKSPSIKEKRILALALKTLKIR